MSLKIERKRCSLSIEDLSRMANVPVRTLQAYECGQRDLRKASFDVVNRIRVALHTSFSYLLDDSSLK